MKLSLPSFSFLHKDRYEKRLLHPLREWFIGIGVFLLCVFIAGAHSTLVFFQYENIDLSTPQQGTDTTIKYNKVLVETVLTRYEERARTFTALLENAPVVIPEETATTTSATSTPNADIEPTEEVSTTTEEVMMSI